MNRKLQDAIGDAILDAEGQEALNTETFRIVVTSLTQFVEEAIKKFIAGQHEHGGSLIDRDLLSELQKEQIDSFWYTSFLKRKLEQQDKQL